MSLGLSWAGDGKVFQSIGALDIWESACRTYAANNLIEPNIGGVSKKTVNQILDKSGDVDVTQVATLQFVNKAAGVELTQQLLKAK
jgi:site-specific DNA-cytosine methylase